LPAIEGGGAVEGLAVVDCSIGLAPLSWYVRDPRLPMLPDEPLLRDPLENPPPDPPRAFAKEIVGTPTNITTRHAARSLVVFKLISFRQTIKSFPC
jgi:hypothetical protein